VQRQLNDANRSASSLEDLGLLALEQGDAAQAQVRLAESLALYTQIANQAGIVHIQIYLGIAYFATGKVQEAEDAYRAGLRIVRRLEPGLWNSQRITACLAGLVEVALAQGNLERAVQLVGASARALASIGAASFPLPPRLRAEREKWIVRGRQALGEPTWEAALAAGETLSLDEALAEVFTPAS
jgi:tetratricopeptide (TPR) repeat protein